MIIVVYYSNTFHILVIIFLLVVAIGTTPYLMYFKLIRMNFKLDDSLVYTYIYTCTHILSINLLFKKKNNYLINLQL